MLRPYSVQFNNVSISAAQDLFGIYCGANMAVVLMEFQLSADASSAVAELRLLIKRLPATVTAGSGGTAPTPAALGSSDSASTFTARANDTTRATTSGTAVNLFAASINVLNGWQFLPPPEYRPTFRPNEACIIGMEVAPGAATVFDGYVVVGELF
jgi:hypothetical protein